MGTSAGQIIEDVDFTNIVLGSSGKPAGRILASGTQSIPHSAYTAILLATEEIDTHNFHSTSVNTSRVTPTIPGLYRFNGWVCMAGRTDWTSIEATLRLNAGTPAAPSDKQAPDRASNPTIMHGTSALIPCDGVADYVEIVQRQVNVAAVASSTAQSVHLTSCLEWEYVRGL